MEEPCEDEDLNVEAHCLQSNDVENPKSFAKEIRLSQQIQGCQSPTPI